MTKYKTALFNLEVIKKKTLSPRQSDILNAFACEDTANAACQIDFYCPALTEVEEAEDYLWTLWIFMIDIASSPDVTSEIHEHFVSILQDLAQIGKGDLLVWNAERRVWRDLPLFPQCMDVSLDDPMNETEEFTPESVQKWRNLCSFAARCMGAGTLGPYVQVVDALREALEEELDTGQHLDRAECRVQVACEWIAHGAKPLLWWAQENIGYANAAEDVTQYFPRGSLYKGPPVVCLQRWGFWQTRFEELGKDPRFSEEIQKAALEAAQTMTAVERHIAHTL
ncbi:hypothetical protein F5Y06DRAFT_98480 [Hypoxylon sp. FL0890]|nr:hypothetical protein F5Y06DRAFT_98480 [Hypoxylon sp. FL0890]